VDRLYLQWLAAKLARDGTNSELASLLKTVTRLDWEGVPEPLSQAVSDIESPELLAIWRQLFPLVVRDLLLQQLHPDLKQLCQALRTEADARGVQLEDS